ncbi:glycoside hydrolase family protein [Sodalis praecaptivus]|uniref:glycoside hydrolase family protein n=1 Tax=Sodalis praecaptivus TaxID=1239307 RepID=UPI0035E3CFF6
MRCHAVRWRFLRNSTLLKSINEGDATGAVAEFPKWCYASIDGKHVPLPGLIKRRPELSQESK